MLGTEQGIHGFIYKIYISPLLAHGTHSLITQYINFTIQSITER